MRLEIRTIVARAQLLLPHTLQRPRSAALSDSVRICTIGGSTSNRMPGLTACQGEVTADVKAIANPRDIRELMLSQELGWIFGMACSRADPGRGIAIALFRSA